MIVGIGNKCRQGKDQLALYMKEQHPSDIEIVHFADNLYEECRNTIGKEKNIPLLKLLDIVAGESAFCLYDGSIDKRSYYMANNYPKLYEFFIKNNLTSYDYMTDKDPLILQSVGEMRRSDVPDYFMLKVKAKIDAILKECPEKIILIPDLRYENEFNYVCKSGGRTVQVKMMDKDDHQIISDSRDANHPSEISLDNYPFHFYILNYYNELEVLKIKAYHLFQKLKNGDSYGLC